MVPRIAEVATSASLALIDWASARPARALALIGLVALLAFLPAFGGLPVTDRDEGRYVMATKQMLETGDFVDIRNQDLPRYKQPAGIYWMQAAAVTLAGEGASAPIGAYRLPSLIGAVAASLLAWWSFVPLVGRRAALLGGMLLAATLLLGVEARIAKTDAALLGTTMLGMGVLVRAFVDARAVGQGKLGYLFWVSVGLGAMIKGPITLLVLAFAAVALSVLARSVRWLGALRPGLGVPIALAIALPWYVAIAIRSDGAFFATALGWNALGKVTDAHQGHGGPPGFYSALVWFTFWPAAPFLAATLGWVWASRRRREVLALLCFVVPLWIMFEALATKLPHYVLPTYPALAMLVALALTETGTLARGWWARLVTHGFWALPAGLLLGGAGLSIWFEGTLPWLATPVLLLAIAGGALAAAVSRQSAEAAAPVAVLAALVTWLGAFPMVASLDTFWPSPRMAAAVQGAATCPGPRVATAGYHEPSFVFLAGTDTLLAMSGGEAADFIAAGGCRLAFVNAAGGRRGGPSDESVFLARLAERGLRAEQVSMVEGRNVNGARLRRMGLWRLVESG